MPDHVEFELGGTPTCCDFELIAVRDLADEPEPDGPLVVSYAAPLGESDQRAVLSLEVAGPRTHDFWQHSAVGIRAVRVARSIERVTHDGMFVMHYLDNGEVITLLTTEEGNDLLPATPLIDDAYDTAPDERTREISVSFDTAEADAHSVTDTYAVSWIVDPWVWGSETDRWRVASTRNVVSSLSGLKLKLVRTWLAPSSTIGPSTEFKGVGRSFSVRSGEPATRRLPDGRIVRVNVRYDVGATLLKGVTNPA